MTAPHRLGAPTAAILTLAAASFLLTACGSDDDPSTTASSAADASERIRSFGAELTGKQAGQAETVVRSYLDARAAGEWSKACSYLAKPNRRLLASVAAQSEQVDGQGCVAGLATVTERLSASERADLAMAEVESVRVDDGRGYVLYTDAGGAEQAIRIAWEVDQWKPAAISAPELSS